MEKRRFEEIIKSNSNHEILYQSHPIWIEDYNPKREVARIKNLDNGEINVVSIGDLEETGIISGVKHSKYKH